MKLRSPNDCVCLSHGGSTVKITEEGAVEIEDNAWDCLAAHGFERWSDRTPDVAEAQIDGPLVGMKKIESGASAAPAGNLDLPRRGQAELRREQTPVAYADASMPTDPIAALNRLGLFAYLKSRGVSASLPITNEQLRVLARRAMNG